MRRVRHALVHCCLGLCACLLLSTLVAPDVAAQSEREREPRREEQQRLREKEGRRTPPSRDRVDRHHSDRDRDQDKPRTRGEDGRGGPGGSDDPDGDLPPLSKPIPSSPAVPLPPAGFGAGSLDLFEEYLLLDCEDTRVCLLAPLDDYVAWMLSGQTTIPWRILVDARIDTGSWVESMVELGIETWELYYAFDRDPPPSELAAYVSDDDVRDLAIEHLGGIEPPGYPCRLPVELEGISQREMDRVNGTDHSYLDSVDDDIAARIEEETGWCRDDLREARRFLGSWARTARQLHVSPFLFEVSFGIRLDVLDLRGKRVVRYPTEGEIRYVAENELWPEVASGR